MLSTEQFIEQNPEFKSAGTALIEAKLTQAGALIDTKVWCANQDLGHGLLTAHLLALSPFGKNAKMVNKEGTTTYGVEYAKLVKIVSGKARPIL